MPRICAAGYNSSNQPQSLDLIRILAFDRFIWGGNTTGLLSQYIFPHPDGNRGRHTRRDMVSAACWNLCPSYFQSFINHICTLLNYVGSFSVRHPIWSSTSFSNHTIPLSGVLRNVPLKLSFPVDEEYARYVWDQSGSASTILTSTLTGVASQVLRVLDREGHHHLLASLWVSC